MNNRKIKTVITHEIMEILTYFFLQIFIIFDCLSDSIKKWETVFSVEFPKLTVLGLETKGNL